MSSNSSTPKKGTEHRALAVSILALVISGITWWDSHRISAIQIAQAAPEIDVTFSQMLPLGDKTGNPSDFTVVMQAVNRGHLGVTVRKTSIHPNVSNIFDDGQHKACIEDVNKQTYQDDTGIDEKFRVGEHRLIVVDVTLPESCKQPGWRFFAEAQFQGVDEVNSAYEGTSEITAIVPPAKP